MDSNIVLKASSKSSPTDLAGAIAGQVREHGKAYVAAIGAGAVNQTIKAVAVARGYVAAGGYDLVCIPAFKTVAPEANSDLSGERTMIEMLIESR